MINCAYQVTVSRLHRKELSYRQLKMAPWRDWLYYGTSPAAVPCCPVAHFDQVKQVVKQRVKLTGAIAWQVTAIRCRYGEQLVAAAWRQSGECGIKSSRKWLHVHCTAVFDSAIIDFWRNRETVPRCHANWKCRQLIVCACQLKSDGAVTAALVNSVHRAIALPQTWPTVRRSSLTWHRLHHRLWPSSVYGDGGGGERVGLEEHQT